MPAKSIREDYAGVFGEAFEMIGRFARRFEI
jgi:hypothetical protein